MEEMVVKACRAEFVRNMPKACEKILGDGMSGMVLLSDGANGPSLCSQGRDGRRADVQLHGHCQHEASFHRAPHPVKQVFDAVADWMVNKPLVPVSVVVVAV